LPTPVPETDNWECDYQPPTQLPGGGRPDLALRPGKGANFGRPIFLESKVGSRLGERQLKNYKNHGTKILVAVTKNRPEVPREKLRQMGVKSLRWQDFCRALRQTAFRGQKEQFLCQSFAEYLEESGMAYREDITKQHLNEISVLLKKIAARKYIETKPELAFKYANSCLELLRDVRASLLERLPKLEQWTSWGPGYFHLEPNKDAEITYHALAFSFTPDKWRSTNPYFSPRFYFRAKGAVQWAIEWDPKKRDSDFREVIHPIDSISSAIKLASGRSVRALDTDKMTKTVEEAARKWRVI